VFDVEYGVGYDEEGRLYMRHYTGYQPVVFRKFKGTL
jgi:hypothetical protein